MHDEDQGALQAVEDCENICHRNRVLMKQEGPEHPHQAEDAHLGNGSHRERSVNMRRERSKNGSFTAVVQRLFACVEIP